MSRTELRGEPRPRHMHRCGLGARRPSLPAGFPLPPRAWTERPTQHGTRARSTPGSTQGSLQAHTALRDAEAARVSLSAAHARLLRGEPFVHREAGRLSP